MKKDKKKDASSKSVLPSSLETFLALKTAAQATGMSLEELIVVQVADWYNLHTSFSPSTEGTPPPEIPEEIKKLLALQKAFKMLNESSQVPLDEDEKNTLLAA